MAPPLERNHPSVTEGDLRKRRDLLSTDTHLRQARQILARFTVARCGSPGDAPEPLPSLRASSPALPGSREG